MTRGIRGIANLATVTSLALVVAACPPQDQPEPQQEPMMQDPAPAAQEDGARERVYEATLQEINGSGVTGTATIALGDDRIQVRVMAQGLQPDQRVPQHIHTTQSCDPAGGILLNLDDDLSHPNEAEPRGDHYPTADSDGVLDYEASRSLDDLRDAALEYESTGIEQLDLGNRVVNLHGEDMAPIACGPLEERRGAAAGQTQPRM